MSIMSNNYKPFFYEIFLFPSGRISRKTCIHALVFLVLFYFNFILLSNILGILAATNVYINIACAWMLFVVFTKRLHDSNYSALRLFWLLLPVVGAVYVVLILLRKSNSQANNYGLRFEDIAYDYFTNPKLKPSHNDFIVVDDITQNNPITVKKVITPTSHEEIMQNIRATDLPLSISGGRFSMGGQTASVGSLHIDMRKMNQIIEFSATEKYIKVQAGIRWCDIQRFINQFGLAIKIMQTYANFTVGGSLSVNVHGRYIGDGPLILSVRDITLILASGEMIEASPQHNANYFYAAIGGYGGIGIISAATFMLVANDNLERKNKRLAVGDYRQYFMDNIRNNPAAVMHNGDIYPPHYKKVNAVTWYKSDSQDAPPKLQKIKKIRLSYRYLLWAISETPLGKWRREHILDRLIFWGKKMHSRNYEAGYDVAELAPIVTKHKFWELQEYFVPVANFDKFVGKISEILQRYRVNALNISIRHANHDSGSYLAWAPNEVFAFVLYFKQYYGEIEQNKIAIWTRELIDAVIECGGSYYLPYQIFATYEQFTQAYPRAKEFMAFKQTVDPTYRLRNKLWDTYYTAYLKELYHAQ